MLHQAKPATPLEDGPATAKQKDYVTVLAKQTGQDVTESDLQRMSKPEASKKINELLSNTEIGD